MYIPLVIQHRHVHLSKADQKILFGTDASLSVASNLRHKGQVVYDQVVEIVGKESSINFVRILGPARAITQVELSPSDALLLGIRAPVRHSGDLARAGSCKIKGPRGMVRATSQVIIPARHLHCHAQAAKKLGVTNNAVVTLQHLERTDVLLHHVLVRVHPTFSLELHLHADEASALWLSDHDLFTICE